MRTHLDLTPLLNRKLFYKSQNKPKTPVVLLSLIICSLIGFIFIGGLLFYSNLKVSSFLAKQAISAKVNLQEVENQKLILEQEIQNIVSSQEYSEYDVVKLASTINNSLLTATGDSREFLKVAIPQAIRIQQRYNIPASAVLGQAIYESGYGKSGLAKQANNFFGLKALSKDWDGDVIWMTTKDYDKSVTHQQPFRKFDSVYDGFSGYVEFLKKYDRYKNVFTAKTGKEFVSRVARAGYCPDKTYTSHVNNIIDRHKLGDLDKFLDNQSKLTIILAKVERNQ